MCSGCDGMGCDVVWCVMRCDVLCVLQGLSLTADTSASNTGDPGMANSAPAGANEEEYLDSDMTIATLK